MEWLIAYIITGFVYVGWMWYKLEVKHHNNVKNYHIIFVTVFSMHCLISLILEGGFKMSKSGINWLFNK